MNKGWIKLHRKLIEWEWYDDVNVMRVFTHLLLTCNHKKKKWRGIVVKAGEKITSYAKLAEGANLSVQQVRTALGKLESTGEITRRPHSKFTLLKLNSWSEYQEDNKQITNKQQTNNKQITTNKNEKNEKNERMKEINISKDILGRPKEKVEKVKKEYGNENINKMLIALKAKIGIDDFADTQKWSRIYGKHCYNLMKKISPQEFSRRLEIILKDDFKRKRCNEIKYVYEQIKGFIEPPDNSRGIRI